MGEKTRAPRPGVSARADASARAQQILVFGMDGDEYRLAWRNVPFGERMLVRKWTGLPYSSFTSEGETIDQDSLALLWCLARRAAGETTLVFNEAFAQEWEAALMALSGELTMRVEFPDDEDNDPEA